jgi:hypothetical protein
MNTKVKNKLISQAIEIIKPYIENIGDKNIWKNKIDYKDEYGKDDITCNIIFTKTINKDQINEEDINVSIYDIFYKDDGSILQHNYPELN